MPAGILNRELKNDAATPAKFSAAALTATDNSESLSLQGLDVFGISIDLPTVTGTSPTLDIKVEISWDGGTNWAEFPADVNSETQATLTQITAAGDVSKYWTVPYGVDKDPDAAAYPLARFVFTVGGTNPSFTFTRIQVFGRAF